MPAPANNSATKWADGIRGTASFLVVTAHLCRSFAPFLLAPTLSEKTGPALMQLPILRCFVMGRASVAVFAIISGYVNALKPTRQTRAGQIDATLSGLAKAAYRRTGRFIAPVVVATLISWFLCQLGAYSLAKNVDSQWIRDTSPKMSPGFLQAFVDLFRNLITTWTSGGNKYDPIQWTMTYLLRGSMLVYLSLFATAYVQPRYRILVYATMEGYYWWIGDAVIGINVFAGLIMAELTYDEGFQDWLKRKSTLMGFVSFCLIFLGMFCTSYPEEKPEWAQWSRAMMVVGRYIFPGGAELARFYPGLGAQLICYGVMMNQTARKIFASPWPCFFGKVSYAVYLTHAPLIRTVLTWAVFGLSTRPPSPGHNKDGVFLPRPWTPQTSPYLTIVIVGLWYVFLYRMALVWTAYVDPFCGRICNWVEQKMFRDESQGEKQNLLA